MPAHVILAATPLGARTLTLTAQEISATLLSAAPALAAITP